MRVVPNKLEAVNISKEILQNTLNPYFFSLFYEQASYFISTSVYLPSGVYSHISIQKYLQIKKPSNRKR